jgi:hypothetical protein
MGLGMGLSLSSSFVRPAPRAFCVSTAYFHRRRAQRRSRTVLLQLRRRFVLDGREHGGRLVWGLYGAGMGLSLSREHHAIFVVLCHSILLFDPRREHSCVSTAYFHRRRAQRRSRTVLLQLRRRFVLDGREHGGGCNAAERMDPPPRSLARRSV